MKRFLALIMVLAMAMGPLALGCATTSNGPSPVTNFFCHPTDSQKLAAKVGVAVAQSFITVGAAYLGVGQLAALVDAQAIYKSVVDGYCVTQAQWDNATNAVDAAQDGVKGMRATPGAIDLLHQTKW